MRIYFSDGQDPMLLNSWAGMTALHEQLVRFVDSDETVLVLPADCSGPSTPYSELLMGLEIRKAAGPIRLELTERRSLSLSGSKENLARYVAFFRFDDGEERTHHHPEHVQIDGYIAFSSMSLIIEVDSSWMGELRAEG